MELNTLICRPGERDRACVVSVQGHEAFTRALMYQHGDTDVQTGTRRLTLTQTGRETCVRSCINMVKETDRYSQTDVYTDRQKDLRARAHTHARIHACTHAHARTHTHTRTHARTHARTRASARTHTYTHKHCSRSSTNK